MKTAAFLSTAVIVGVTLVTSAAFAAAPLHHAVTIRHQTSHCHTWALDKGSYKAHIDATLAVGGSLTVTNNDVMPHRLLELSGPRALYSQSPSLSHMGATVKVTFPRAGVYEFKTKVGEDYMKGVKTTGEDNVLTMKVVVR